MQKTASSELPNIESEIKKTAGELSVAQNSYQELESKLKQLIDTYQEKRQQAQRDSWKTEGVDWCPQCGKLYPSDETKLLYTVYFGEGPDHHRFLTSYCEQCANKRIQSRENISVGGVAICGGHLVHWARKSNKGDGFEYLDLGERVDPEKGWEPIDDLEEVSINIGSGKISEGRFTLGKPIMFYGLSTLFFSEIKIDEEKIL